MWVVDTLVVSSRVKLEGIERQFWEWFDVHSVRGKRKCHLMGACDRRPLLVSLQIVCGTPSVREG